MIENTVFKQTILDELSWDSRVDATHVFVTAGNGVVTLTGHVRSFPEIFFALEAVRRVAGVRAIADELTVRLPSAYERDDTSIAESIAHVLSANLPAAEMNIQADVSEGLVTLTGAVDWQSQRLHAENQVSHITGVKGIYNQITLRERPVPDDVKSQIEQALVRNAELEAEHVSVTVAGDKVTLEGRVRSFYERNLVEWAVWSAPGVRQVVDRITVE